MNKKNKDKFVESWFCEPSDGECENCGDEEPVCIDCGKCLSAIFGEVIYCCDESGKHLCEKCFNKREKRSKGEQKK